MPQFTTFLDLPWPRAEVFDFLAKPVNVAALSLPEMYLQVLEAPERLHLGARLTWKGRRWGLSHRVVTEVTAFEENVRIVEEQRAGPFARWLHARHFDENAAQTRVSDHIDFEPPTGMLGRLLTVEVTVHDLRAAFAYRDQKLTEFFSFG